MTDDTIPVRESATITALGRPSGFRLAEFRWLLSGGLLLILFIALAEYAGLPPALELLIKILRLPLGLVYVLFVPGYCLTAASFPGAADLDGIERTGLGLGLSIAWVPVIALVLDRLPWGLRLWPIVIGQLLSILLFTAVALWRRSRLPIGEAYAPPHWRPLPWWRGLPPAEKRIYRLCAAALLLAGAAVAWVFLVPSPDEFMTEFYILGPEGLAENYPRQAAPGERLAVTMGIANRERQPMTYRVEIWAVDSWNDRRQQVGAAGPVALDVEESVEQPVTWSMPWPGDDQVVEFYLVTPSQNQPDPEPYRRLRLWLNVTQ